MVEKSFDIVAVGEINPDLILRGGDVVPGFGQVEKMVDDATLTIGSSTVIFAAGAARLGLRVAFIGKVGGDEFGRFMVAQMAARGVDTSGVVVDRKLRTGLSVILSRGADRAILTYAGSIGALRFDEIDRRLLVRARHLHLGSFFLLDELRPDVPALFDLAHAEGLTVSLDTNYDPTEAWDGGLAGALARADVFIPNETELKRISGETTIEAGLARLARQVPTVAVKLGGEGGMARQGDRVTRAPALPVQVIDTTGAGDTFDAGFLYGVLCGWPLEKSLRLACACGSLSTRASGGTEAQPTREEALSYLE